MWLCPFPWRRVANDDSAVGPPLPPVLGPSVLFGPPVPPVLCPDAIRLRGRLCVWSAI